MKSRDSEEIDLKWAASGNPFFDAIQTKLTAAKTRVEAAEPLFDLLSVQDCLKTGFAERASGQDCWKTPI